MEAILIRNDPVEQALLWSIMMDSSILFDLELVKEDFFSISNQLVFEAIQDLNKEQVQIDLLTVKTKLEDKKQLNEVGWIVYLSGLTEIVQSISNVKEYNKILKEASNKRKLSELAREIQFKIMNWEGWESIVTNITNKTSSLEWIENEKSMDDFHEETLSLIDKLKNQETSLIWYSWWKEFDWLDKATGWIIPGKIYRLAWGSNDWKSWFMYWILISCLQQGADVSFFALENDEIFTLKNLYWIRQSLNTLPHILQANKDVDFSPAALWFSSFKSFRVETKHKTLSSIFRKAVKNKSNIIFIDYIQAFKEEQKYQGDKEKFTDYALRVQEFANKYNIAVFDLSQISNWVKRDWVDWGGSDEFKGSWELKSAADVGLHIFRWDDCDDGYLNNRIVKLTKNRLWPWVWTKINYIMNFHKGGKWIKDVF